MVLRVLGIAAIGGGILLLAAIVRRREKPWPHDGHGQTYFTTSAETRKWR